MADVDNHETEIADLEKQMSEIEEKLEKLGKTDDSESDKLAKGADDESDDDVKKEEEPLKRVRLSKKTDDETKKAWPKKSKAADAEDEDEDMAEDAADGCKKADVKKAADDESVVIEGQQILKSAVGEASFAIFKASEARLAKAEQEIAKERDLRETAEFQKRADDLYSHVPGTVEERGALLKAISKMDKTVKKSFETILTHSEKLAKAAFDTVGVKGPVSNDVKKGAQDFEAKVSEIRKRDNCSRADAMTKARAEHEDLFKAYQASN